MERALQADLDAQEGFKYTINAITEGQINGTIPADFIPSVMWGLVTPSPQVPVVLEVSPTEAQDDDNPPAPEPEPSSDGADDCGDDYDGLEPGESFELHHSDPKFIGGARTVYINGVKQELTKMSVDDHREIHKLMYEFLDTKVSKDGKRTMRPKRGNCGPKIRAEFGRQALLKAMAEFYRGPGAKFSNAARDFFKIHPTL